MMQKDSLADNFIQRKRKEYANPASKENMSKLNSDLTDIHNVMRQNIQEVLSRGERIEGTVACRERLQGRRVENVLQSRGPIQRL